MANVYRDYFNTLLERLRTTYLERRKEERQNELRLMSEEGDDSSTSTSTDSALKVTSVTFYPQGNGKHHRTSKFQLVERGTPILRRGQTFFIAIAFGQDQNKRQYDSNRDEIWLRLSFGPQSSPMNGTQQVIKVDKLLHTDENRWAARIKGHDKNAVTIEVRSSSDSCVGIWKCKIETKTKVTYSGAGESGSEGGENSPKAQVYDAPDDIYLLFNPWEPSDVTYMKDKELLNEYVLEEMGKIWVGPHTSTRGRSWSFGQFDDSVLPLIMILLEKSGLALQQRGNPILVSRALSKMVNSNDDKGILVGRWDGKYSDGTPPSGWTGSVPIIEQYFQTMKPVKYGQCWVFAGVLGTVCRALGLPCRVVSNLVSAHDSNGSLTIDRYFNDKNDEINYDPNNPHGGKDSIWNFHVWNDVFMSRRDLPKGYGGWQAIDSTPQEQSDGMYRCGPASLEAVRKGKVGYSYDVPFVLAEVNADVVRWREDKSNDFGFIRMEANKYHVGRQILTKKPNVFDSEGDSDRWDIIEEYKPKEGTRMERLQLVNAVQGSNRQGAASFFELNPKDKDVDFDLIELEQVPVGEPFSLVVKITNKSKETRTVQADLTAESMYYTGVKGKLVKRAAGKFVVRPDSNEELRMTVLPDEYMGKLVEYGIMKMFAICAVDETNQAWSEEDDFQVVKPPLNIKVTSNLTAGKPAYATFSFINPLKRNLTKCVINYEGPFLVRFSEINLKDVGIGEELEYVHRFIPRSSGSHQFIATFTSKELIDIVGSIVIEVN
ncbi:hemocyte protein-glutamine gamma-glutamyltransferase [Folsomia candida]|uniref:hemocyte protein-glutamine gamma-glutamyltransferase n=1 Tax=Folsomia candida TaxID=158441 RepID=UPI000B904F56|nr:hemocyte protein-glutamine gamma-glutamyltransferase [Folsomia candida]